MDARLTVVEILYFYLNWRTALRKTFSAFLSRRALDGTGGVLDFKESKKLITWFCADLHVHVLWVIDKTLLTWQYSSV